MDRYFTDPDLLGRVPGLLLILGGIYLGMGMVACLLINQPPEDWIQRYTTIQPTTRGLDTQVHNHTTNHQRTGYTGTQLFNQPQEDWIHRDTTILPNTRGLDTQVHHHTTNHQRT